MNRAIEMATFRAPRNRVPTTIDAAKPQMPGANSSDAKVIPVFLTLPISFLTASLFRSVFGPKGVRVAIDIGGTFTDLVAHSEGSDQLDRYNCLSIS